MKQKRLSTLAIITLSLTISFLAVYWGMVIPEMRSWDADSKQAAQQAQAHVTTAPAATLASQDVDPASATEAAILLPPDTQQYDVAIQIEALVHSLGVGLTSLGLGTPATVGVPTAASTSAAHATIPATSSASRLPITLAVTGSYASIQQVVGGLAQLNRAISVDQVSLSSVSGGTGKTTGEAQLSAQLALSAYYLPPKAVAATPKP